jgi:hypothetical protein
MGTLGKDGSIPLIFDGRPESWPLFKKALHQLLDKEGYGWVLEGGDVFCAMLQAASAKAAKMCVFITAGPITKLCAWGRRRVEDMCYEIRRAEAKSTVTSG